MEDVACINSRCDVVKDSVVAVGDNSVGEAFEFGQVVDDARAEEGRSILEGRLVDDYGRPLGLDALHHALD